MQHSNRRFVWKFSVRLSTLQQRLEAGPNGVGSSEPIPFASTTAASSSSSDAMISVTTPALLIVRQRLKISVSSGCNAQLAQAAELLASGGDDWKTTALTNPTIHNILNNTSSGHVIWYKDEGGKDHGLDVTVTLIDAHSTAGGASSTATTEVSNDDTKDTTDAPSATDGKLLCSYRYPPPCLVWCGLTGSFLDVI